MHKIVLLRHGESVWNKENQHRRKRATVSLRHSVRGSCCFGMSL